LTLKNAQGNPDLKEFAYLKTVYLGFAINRPEVSAPELRRAIAMAIDKTSFGTILYGHQKASFELCSPSAFSSGANLGLPYSIEKAKAELKKLKSPPGKIDLLIS